MGLRLSALSKQDPDRKEKERERIESTISKRNIINQNKSKEKILIMLDF